MVVTTSRFGISSMPEKIHPRQLEPYSVHFNTSAKQWVTTMVRPERNEFTNICFQKFISVNFSSEREAKLFAKANSPPKMHPKTNACQICSVSFHGKNLSSSCRNCGACICSKCSTRWGIPMFPKTYVSQKSLTARVCKTCDWLSNAFCIALLQGNRLQDVKLLYKSRNLNLRACFANIHQEAMYPVHCAVMGGNLQLLRWLVETHGCPIFVKNDSMTGSKQSLRTTGSKSLIDLAMTGKPKLDILHYLVITHNMSVEDTTNPRMALRSLDALLREKDMDKEKLQVSKEEPALIEDCASEVSTDTIEDACTLCQERNMDCVMTPCGHQLCCHECGMKLSFCPTCKVSCTVLKIYRQT